MAGSWIRFLVVLCVVCESLGVSIINCNNNKVEIFEDSPAPVTCGDITSATDVVWRRGDGVYIGECKVDGTCTTALYNDYSLSRTPQSTESQLTLVPDYRRHAGLTVTCQDIGNLPTASCTFVIRHVEGPSDGVISETHHPGSNGSIIVTLSCNTTGAVYPGVNFTWSPVVCQNETHTARSSTCTISLEAKDDGKSVTCTAINSYDSQKSFSTSVTLRINGAGNVSVVSTTDSSSSASAVIGPVVGAVVTVAVAAIIAILLFILIRRRRQKLKKTPKKTTKSPPYNDSEFEEHINAVYDSSENAG